jgi:hypothetical protein
VNKGMCEMQMLSVSQVPEGSHPGGGSGPHCGICVGCLSFAPWSMLLPCYHEGWSAFSSAPGLQDSHEPPGLMTEPG